MSKDKPDKPKMQFSKLHVLFANFIVLFVYIVSAVLSFMDKQPISDVAIAIITVYGAFATGGYFAQNIARDTSLNRLEAVKSRYEHEISGEDSAGNGRGM